MATVPTQVRIDQTLKEQSVELFSQLGIDMSSAVNMFLKQCVMRDGLPFEVTIPRYKQEVLEAMEEAKSVIQQIKNGFGSHFILEHFNDIFCRLSVYFMSFGQIIRSRTFVHHFI